MNKLYLKKYILQIWNKGSIYWNRWIKRFSCTIKKNYQWTKSNNTVCIITIIVNIFL